MRIRAKIGFMALQSSLTIQELILHGIYKTLMENLDHMNFEGEKRFR